MTNIKWTFSAPGSILYAAGVVAQNQAVSDAAIDELLIQPVSDINSQLGMADLDLGQFWSSLVASGFENGDDVQRCEAALLDADCSPLSADTLARNIAGKLTDIRLAFNERFPKLAEQLPLRGGPLKTSWEERGPGLLVQITNRTHPGLLPKRASIQLVQPIRGGGGDIDPRRLTLWVEAMLTNVDTNVPEVLRVAWLLARLGMAHGSGNRMVDPDHLPAIAAVALVPIVLSAGQELDLVPPGPLPIEAALKLWQQAPNPSTTAVLNDWWQQWTTAEMPFPVALKALDRMLFA
ncbi:hypothetical protein [Roseimaritima ulvae]|uniref:Uncharacterized protein n=1 Tax=Roseimaritima ulvae TaxID=980254 RepID=A0A5B9QP82_9BACT|nr:hypothetical protein [Roseimaritima ulvae]QEG39470.1 hypothetical protein UC8_14650 [Roseimaritima ulvae]